MSGKQRIKGTHALSLWAIAVQIFAFACGCERNQTEVEPISQDGRTSPKGVLVSDANSLTSSRFDGGRPSLRKKLEKMILESAKIIDIDKIKGGSDQSADPNPDSEAEHPSTPTPKTVEPSLADYGPPVRMIGFLETTNNGPEKDPCPNPSQETGWRGGRAFSIEGFAEELCNEIGIPKSSCSDDMKQKIVEYGVPEGLHYFPGVYCEFIYVGPQKDKGVDLETETLGTTFECPWCLPEKPKSTFYGGVKTNWPSTWNHINPLLVDLNCDNSIGSMSKFDCYVNGTPMQLEVDPATVVPQDGGIDEFVTRTRELKHNFAITHLGGLDSLPKSQHTTRVAVLDSSPPAQDETVGLPQPGQLSHGRDVALLIRNLACPSNNALNPEGECKVAVDHYLALDLERDEAGNIVSNKKLGGFFGTPLNLAIQIWKATVRHGLLFPNSRLVINMSVGWENLSDWTTLGLSGDAVALALEFAACNDAISIAAAGNQREGSQPASGPVGPAVFVSLDQKSCGQLVYAIGGLDGMNRPLLNARKNGMPKLAAHAYQVVGDARFLEPEKLGLGLFDRPPLTGSSMGAAAVSAIAALILSYDHHIDKNDLIDHIIYGSSDPLSLPREADFCSADDRSYGRCPEIRRASLCNSLNVMFPSVTCAPIQEEEPTWTADMLAMLEGDAGIIDTTIAPNAGTYTEISPPPPVPSPWVCGDYSVNVPSYDSNPNYVCPDRQLFNDHVFTYLGPEPPHVGCDVCGIHGVWDVLYVMLEDETQLASTPPAGIPPAPATTTNQVGDLLSLELKLTDAAGDVSTYLLASDTSTQNSTLEEIQDGNFVSFDLTNVTGGANYSGAEIIQVVQGHNNQDIVITEQIPVIE